MKSRINLFLTLIGCLGLFSNAMAADAAGLQPPNEIAFATACVGSPQSAQWVLSTGEEQVRKGNLCFLPWAEDWSEPGKGQLMPHSQAMGWVDIQITKMDCGIPPTPMELLAQITPQKLSIRIPAAGGTPGGKRQILVQVRSMKGMREDGKFKNQGWNPWQKILTQTIDSKVKILEIPFQKVTTGTGHWVQIEVQIQGGKSRRIDIIWPVSC